MMGAWMRTPRLDTRINSVSIGRTVGSRRCWKKRIDTTIERAVAKGKQLDLGSEERDLAGAASRGELQHSPGDVGSDDLAGD